MIHIDVDTAVTVPVNIMPLMDDTDFITRETAITYNQAGMDLVWNFVTSAGVITQTAVTPTTAGDYDWTHVGDGMYKIEIPASGGASINNDTEGTGYFTGICTGVLAWRSPDIVFRAAALNDALIDGGDNLDVNMTLISGDSTAADNLESMYDGTGYTDPNAPSTQSQVDSIGASSGGSVNIEATEDNTGGAIIDAVTFVGSVQSGTFANTESEDGVYHDIDDTVNDIDIVYGFDVGGGRTATSVSFDGFVQASADEMKIKVYDHVGSDWEIIGTVGGQNGTDNILLELPLLLKHTGTGAELGKVYIRFDTDSTTPANLSVDRLLVSAVASSASLGFVNGAVWIDTVSGTAGTGAGTGTITAPVSNIDDALTIAVANNLSDLHIAPGSTVTPTGAVANYDLIGHEYTINFNSQSFAGSYIEGASVAASTATGAGIIFKECIFDSNVTLPPCTMRFCYWGNVTLTAGSTGDFFLNDCRSRVSGSDSPAFNFNAVAVGLSVRSYSGGLKLTNMAAGDTASIEGTGAITEVTSTGGSVSLRGAFAQNSITNITVTQDDVKDSLDIITDTDGVVLGAAGVDLIWDEVLTGATHNVAASAGRRLRGITAVPTLEGTINDGSPTSTSFATTLTGYGDSSLSDGLLMVEHAADQWEAKAITSYTSSTGTFTFDEPFSSTLTNGDTISVQVTHIHTIGQIATEVWSTSGRALSDPAGFKKNTAVNNFTFLMIDSTDHVTPITGETVTAERSIDGAAFGACTNSVSEISDGMYKINFSASDMNGDIVAFKFTASGSDPRYITVATET